MVLSDRCYFELLKFINPSSFLPDTSVCHTHFGERTFEVMTPPGSRLGVSALRQ